MKKPDERDEYGRAPGTRPLLNIPRWSRRAHSRDLARKAVQRPAARYEPADNQPECQPHHRKLPCRRCTP